MVLKKRKIIVLLSLIILLLGACSELTEGSTLFNSPESPQFEVTSISTPAPQRILSICLGEEPESLFLYGDVSTSAKIIRQAIYDSPVDEVDFHQSSVLLDPIPSLENGSVIINEIEVLPGEWIVDADGDRTILASGVTYRPASCSGSDCWEVYDNQESILLDQVEITFKIMSGLSWSDGSPLTPEDSIFSYQVARQIYGSTGPVSTRYTADYDLADAGDILWKGIPGYQGISFYTDMFFQPLPEHLWSNLTREELLTSAQTTQSPIGWGPYRIVQWIRGDHITLVNNDHYHLVDQGLPNFDSLVFRFVDSGEEALAAFFSGECQLIANEPGLVNYQADLLFEQQEGLLEIYTVGGNAWEQLSFGINSLKSGSRIFSSVDLRQVVAKCVDRDKIKSSRLDAGQVVDDFYFPGDPRLENSASLLPYQPVEAGLQLRELGWIDHDGDPITPREAEGIEGVNDGTLLQVVLLAVGEDDISPTLNLIREGLTGCGMGVEIKLQPAGSLLEFGPDGPIFGRNFDLAFFSWAAGHYQLCRLFTTDEIPGMYPQYPKGWGGVNATGYSNPDFDSLCRDAHTTLPDSGLNLRTHEQMSMLFEQELPVLPLFFRNEIIIAEPELEGLENSFFPLFWNIEALR